MAWDEVTCLQGARRYILGSISLCLWLWQSSYRICKSCLVMALKNLNCLKWKHRRDIHNLQQINKLNNSLVYVACYVLSIISIIFQFLTANYSNALHQTSLDTQGNERWLKTDCGSNGPIIPERNDSTKPFCICVVRSCCSRDLFPTAPYMTSAKSKHYFPSYSLDT